MSAGSRIRPRLSIVDLAEQSGLMDLNPSDLVCEATALGITYYDYVISSSFHGTPVENGCMLYLAKFDVNTNLESLETVKVPASLFQEGLPDHDLSLAILGMLTWKAQIARSRVMCLVRSLHEDCAQALEALKRVSNKFKCLHHVQASRPPAPATSRTTARANEGMRLRVMLCQTRSTMEFPPAQAVRETKALLEPSSNPLLCLCFTIS